MSSSAKLRRTAVLDTPTDLKPNAVRDISGVLNILLADMFALYLKTKNFHWHVSGPHFRDYHLLLDEQADQIFATTDAIAERVRKIGGVTLRSIGHVGRLQRCSTMRRSTSRPWICSRNCETTTADGSHARDAWPMR
jgi:starvation-inducible DNA-binding protein